ncbi:unnamed protein product [Parascedosporium putredinis]|uniref:Uncharacterized protein n=1 Tax=Parascedosporium putredinis TaxID=1442378 RepID=A0A9P1H2I0_9PEZI|nr:unnamed protein product [Parascedosporium putredinis]CAI7996135.1 unnamed protein product [Parascedosporium putredinis]
MDHIKGHAHNCHVNAPDGTDKAYRFTPTEGWDRYSRRMNENLHVCRKCKVAPPVLRRRVAEREDEEIYRHALGSSPNLYCGGAAIFCRAEVEKLYWLGVRNEIENIIETLKRWREVDGSAPSSVTTSTARCLNGYEGFLENVSQWSRESAEMYRKGVDEVDQLIDARDQYPLNLNSYDRSTASVLTQRKSKLMAFKMGKEIRENLKPVLVWGSQQDAWLLLNASGLLDIDKLIEHRTPTRSTTKGPCIPQLALAKFDRVGMPQFKVQRCLQPGCDAPIVASYFTYTGPDKPSLVCETCYRLHHHGSEGYTKTYKHVLCNDVITAEAAKRICRCADVKKFDRLGKGVALYPHDKTLNESEARAKYDGLLSVSSGSIVSGASASRLADVVSKMTKSSPAANSDEKGRASLAKKSKRLSLFSRKAPAAESDDALVTEDKTPKEPRVITDPASDPYIPPFFQRFADPNGLGRTQMSLRLGPVVFEIGASNTRGGALVSLRQPPVFRDDGPPHNPSETQPSLAVDGKDKSVWQQKRSVGPRKRYKAILKQVVGSCFNECPKEGPEYEISNKIEFAAVPWGPPERALIKKQRSTASWKCSKTSSKVDWMST